MMPLSKEQTDMIREIMPHQGFTHFRRRILSAPIMINLELTSGCNARCRHCYNFWRDDSSLAPSRMTREQFDQLLEMIVSDQVFHVVLTGGEPFLNFDVLEYALTKLHQSNVSTSVNSNLMLASPDKIKRLKGAGMDHVLTSLNSHHPETNDYMVNQKGAFEKIIQGIAATLQEGVRVSANMIISEPNQDHVYETARLCASLGVQKIFATRLVPCVTVKDPNQTDFRLDRQGALRAIDDLLRAQSETGIAVGTLISYPLCMLCDLEKYQDFVGRGCPAQRGNRMVVNADGQTHACTHESRSYGNVFSVGIREAFKNMHPWHDGSYLFEGCRDCAYINVCGAGCRSAAFSYHKALNQKDPLFAGPENIRRHYALKIPDSIVAMVRSGLNFVVPKTLRFRKEDGFYTINIRWADAFCIDADLAEFLIHGQASQKPVRCGDLPEQSFLHLVYKEALVPKDPALREKVLAGVKKGCSINPDDLPPLFEEQGVIP